MIQSAIDLLLNICRVAEAMLATKFAEFVHQPTGTRLIRALDGYSLPEEVANHVLLVGGVLRLPSKQLPFALFDFNNSLLIVSILFYLSYPDLFILNIYIYRESYWTFCSG